MKVTSTINFSKTANGWSGIKKHVEHDPNVKHSNKDILKDLTQFNINGRVFSQAEIDRKMDDYFGDYVKQHDQSAFKNRHPERVYGSVKRFLQSKKKITVVATVGDMEDRNKLIQQLCPKGSYKSIDIPSSPDGKTLVITDSKVAKKFYGTYEKALSNFVSANYKMNGVRLFNYLVPGAYSIHVDEAGAPHIHYELYATGKTRNGRVSNSLNQTLVNIYERVTGKEKANGREALKWYRLVFDREMARLVNKEFSKEYGDHFKGIEFYRKGTKDVGRSMEQVKNLKTLENKLDKERDHFEIQKINDNEALDILDNDFEEKKKSFEQEITSIADEIEPDRPRTSAFEWLKEFVRKLKERWDKLIKREKQLNQRERELGKREKILAQHAEQLSKLEPSYREKVYENAVKLMAAAEANRHWDNLSAYVAIKKTAKDTDPDKAFELAYKTFQLNRHEGDGGLPIDTKDPVIAQKLRSMEPQRSQKPNLLNRHHKGLER